MASSSLLLPNCGVMLSGQCADKATCPQADSGAQLASIDAAIGELDAAPEANPSGVATEDVRGTSNPESSAVDVTSDVASPEATADDAGADLASQDAFNEIASGDAATGDAGVRRDAATDGPSDAVFMGDTRACGPCTNACVPSFVQCCISDGGCGCIEFFFPVLCM
jgi:hypothetical protein